MSNIIDFFYEPEVLSRDFLYQKYVVEGLSCVEISRSVASSRTTILKRLKEHNIPVREIGKNLKRKRGVAYGQKVEKMQTLAHKRELEVIAQMKRLRDQGHSYRKIADILNAMGVPTKMKKGKWHGKSVHQILNKPKSA